ncbi:acyl-CoA reductase [uncultured Cytophaga sp.]|uniref:acyl-CoA reductase n=1 Tax=uncultured Cytophaga sp. TaxID=160238 RepID=UPI002617DEF4|nr:acyl-CoA reductase [uncultured Cytophaga sp.]
MKSLHTDLQTFVLLQDYLKNIGNEELNEWLYRAEANNPWFTQENVKSALIGIIDLLDPKALENFFTTYKIIAQEKKIGVIMAGNIPAVGFHDLLCVLLSGNILYAKLSSEDTILLKKIGEVLIKINPSYTERLFFVDQLKNMDAYITTGSDNSAKHFEYYFRNTPHIIRKNRTSVAIIDGKESQQELITLGEDVFSYFGLGCRNVSHLFLPMNYDPTTILTAWEGTYNNFCNHNKYMNNYEYNKAILLIDLVPHLDAGYILLKEAEGIFSQIATLTYSFYKSENDLLEIFTEKANQLQCVVSSINSSYYNTVRIGATQRPSISDFADGVDTMAFLVSL